MQALARGAASEIARGFSTGIAVWASRSDCVCAPTLQCPLCPDCHCVGGLTRASDSPLLWTHWAIFGLAVLLALLTGFAAGRFGASPRVGTTPVDRPEVISESPQLILARPRRGGRGVWGVGHGGALTGGDAGPGGS